MEDRGTLSSYSVVRVLKRETNRPIYEHMCASLSNAQFHLFYICDFATIFPRKSITDFDSRGPDLLFIIRKNIWCALERAACHQTYTECLFQSPCNFFLPY